MDDIQRKLELIDRQLAGGQFVIFHKRIVSTAPLLFAAVGLIAGILIQDTFGLPILFWLISVGVCIAATIILYVVYHRKEEQLPYILAYTALVCFACLGAIRLISFEQLKSDDICNFVGGEKELTAENAESAEENNVQFLITLRVLCDLCGEKCFLNIWERGDSNVQDTGCR